jgi:hypothetical protein
MLRPVIIGGTQEFGGEIRVLNHKLCCDHISSGLVESLDDRVAVAGVNGLNGI